MNGPSLPRRPVLRQLTHDDLPPGRRARGAVRVVATLAALCALTALLSSPALATHVDTGRAGKDARLAAWLPVDARAADRAARTDGDADTRGLIGPRGTVDVGETDGQPHVARYVWPLAPPVTVSAPFAAPPEPWAAGHRGVDLDAPPGTVVRAPAPGVVTFVGVVAGRGVLTLTHGDGLRSSVEPVTAVVAVGDRVAAGDAVGTVSPDGGHCAAAACLHWGVRRGDVYLDPVTLVEGGPIVLLPTR